MKITQFLTGVAAAALLAGAANAYELVANNVDEDFADAAGVEAEITLATEVDFTSGVDGFLEFEIVQEANNVFTTDDVILTLSLQGATFNGTVGIANLIRACSTSASVISGGGDGGTAISILISGLDGCDHVDTSGADNVITGGTTDAFGFRIPVTVSQSTQDVVVTTNIVTDSGGTPVDGGQASLNIIDFEDAFSVAILPEGADEIADLDADPIYTLFQGAVGARTLGTVELECENTFFWDLGVNNVDCSGAQIEGLDVTIDGDFTAMASTAIGGIAGTIAPDGLSATYDIAALADNLAGFGGGAAAVTITPDTTTAIQRSSYDVSVEVDLLDPPYADESPFTGSLDDVLREGTQVIFPWLPSASQVSGTGATHVVRFANLSDVDARVFVEVLASSVPGFTSAGPVQVDDLPALGELSYNSSDIEAAIGSNFGRGEVEFTIETTSDNVTARRIAVAADGQFTDLDAGTVEQDQN